MDPQKGYWRGQMINKAKDGREIPVILTITAVKDNSGEIIGYVSNAIDMTEQLALQARVADSEALATIGEMAAVVVHEIRNPLGSIVMAAKQLAGSDLSDKDHAMVLQVLKTESSRLNEALTNFLAYGRPRELKLQRAALNGVVQEVFRMIQSNAELIKEIEIDVALDSALKPFPMDPDQIRQVLWNILLNAVQAMGSRGTMTIKTGRRGEWAFFRVKDTGPGISKETMKKLFKPFQTTKQQGTGLGLAIADRIIKAHGGRIEVESRGRGAAFTVYLPSIEA
jgi:signal transduction histidine kinase